MFAVVNVAIRKHIVIAADCYLYAAQPSLYFGYVKVGCFFAHIIASHLLVSNTAYIVPVVIDLAVYI